MTHFEKDIVKALRKLADDIEQHQVSTYTKTTSIDYHNQMTVSVGFSNGWQFRYTVYAKPKTELELLKDRVAELEQKVHHAEEVEQRLEWARRAGIIK